MIPYFESPHISFFGLYRFGILYSVFFSLGFIAAMIVAKARAGIVGMGNRELFITAFWTMVSVGVFSHVVNVFTYTPYLLERDGLKAIFQLWNGSTSYGGFFGGVLAVYLYTRKKKRSMLLMGDAFLPALALGEAIGRFGCFVDHHHVGRLTNFFLAVNFPYGARHDLGLYESVFLFFVLLPGYRFVNRFGLGAITIWTMMGYATARFFFDFLRATDTVHAEPRYLGLTPAQYFSILTFCGGIWIWRYKIKKEI